MAHPLVIPSFHVVRILRRGLEFQTADLIDSQNKRLAASTYSLLSFRDGKIGESHITILVAQNITIHDIIMILARCL